MFDNDEFDALMAVEKIFAAGRAESASIAARFAAIAQLDNVRVKQWKERELFVMDPFGAIAAEVSAAMSLGRSRGAGLLYDARMLRDRLPAVMKVFSVGDIDFRIVRTVIARTDTVDGDAIGDVDAAIARVAHRWMCLSEPKLRDRIDKCVAKYDPAGVRVPPKADESRYVDVVPSDRGMAGIFANVHAPDAAAFDQRLDAMAATVCDNDPRTKVQRRADAVGALGRGEALLTCGCGQADCPAVREKDAAAAAASVVIHVLSEQATLDGTSDDPGYLPGLGILPADSVREMAAGANVKLKPVVVPEGGAQPGYRPSAALADFVGWRDLTCRFPGCDAPVPTCEYEHTVPWPIGATHPSCNKYYCKSHPLLKTFYSGPGGWAERQLSDGTMLFVGPTGHTYRTEAHGAALFRLLATPTGAAPGPAAADMSGPAGYRGAKMPKRRQTREQDRQDRIAAERQLRADIIEEQKRQQWLADTDEPPPF